MRNDAFANVVYWVDRQYRPESSPKKMPESNIMPENRVAFTFLKPPINKKMIVSAIRPAKLRQNDTKSPGASMKRVNAPMPPIKDDEQNIMINPMSLYFALSFIGTLFPFDFEDASLEAPSPMRRIVRPSRRRAQRSSRKPCSSKQNVSGFLFEVEDKLAIMSQNCDKGETASWFS